MEETIGTSAIIEKEQSYGEFDLEVSYKGIKLKTKGFDKRETAEIIKHVLAAKIIYFWLFLFTFLLLLILISTGKGLGFIKSIYSLMM